MNRPQITRLLRLSWTVCWCIACVLLLVLWMRSYYRRDLVGGTVLSHVTVVESADGNIAVQSYFQNPAFSSLPWTFESYGPKSMGFGRRLQSNFQLTDGSLVLLFAFLAAVPWLHLIKLESMRKR